MNRDAFAEAVNAVSLAAVDASTSLRLKYDRPDMKARRNAALSARQFVIWDGEGARSGNRKPQNYVLFGAYDGAEHHYITDRHLTTHECLAHIMRVGRLHADRWHVGFAFDYDVNMILSGLTVRQFRRLRVHRSCLVGDYRVEHIPGKWFRVTRNGETKETVTIFDVWGFFQTSFVKALKANIPDHPLMIHLSEIEAGKDKRADFTYAQLEFITDYWRIEGVLFHALVCKLRELLYDAGLFIAKWHGPGELAAFAYRTNGIRPHKADCGTVIYDCARFAYAGGRFERFHIGRYSNAFGYDINSAYPTAIALLPSLSEGKWIHSHGPFRADSLEEFAVYRIRLRRKEWETPSPVFHRDWRGTISYPWKVDGWYWTPEIRVMLKHHPELADCVQEGWEYIGWQTRPFAFVANVYERRRAMKAAGIGTQMALKLLLNSLYGKMAQRAGWERSGKAPTWHQLEWAGWVTSHTRATLYDLMVRIPWEQLIAVETDGLYTTATPDELGIQDSKELGGWEVSECDELIYLQSGFYAKRTDRSWSLKYRGLDAKSVSVESVIAHTHLLLPNAEWPKLTGTTTRFVGYQNALFRESGNRGPFAVHHRVWENENKEFDIGRGEKRVHQRRWCRACAAGLSAWDMPHDTRINLAARAIGKGHAAEYSYESYPHDIPWLDTEFKPEWRERLEEEEGVLL